MAINLGSLLTGATKAVGAYDQNRAAAQRQAEQDTLSRALLARQISQQDEAAKLAAALNAAKVRNLDAVAGTKGQKIVQGEDGFYIVNPTESTATPVRAAPGATPATAAPEATPVAQTADVGLPAPPQAAAPQGAPPQKSADLGKILQPKKPVTPYAKERDADVRARMAAIRQRNPNISAEEANKQARIEAGLQPQAPPTPQYTPLPVGGEAGGPDRLHAFDARTGALGPDLGPARGASGAQAGQQKLTEARARAAVSEMGNAHKSMYDYEQKLKNGTTSINGLAQFLGAVGSSFTHDDPGSRAAQTAALTILNNVNPELARYIRQGLTFAESESLISQRPSDFRTKMSAFLSQAASGASPELISDIERRRQSLLDPLNEIYGNQAPQGGGRAAGGGAAPAPAAKRTITRAQYDGLIKLGRTPEEIQAHYTVQP